MGQPLAVRGLPGAAAAGLVPDQEHRLDDQDDRAEHVGPDRGGRPHLHRLGHDGPVVPRQDDGQGPLAAIEHALRRHDGRPAQRGPQNQGEDRAAGRRAQRPERRGGRCHQRGRLGDGPVLGRAGRTGQDAQGQGRSRAGRPRCLRENRPQEVPANVPQRGLLQQRRAALRRQARLLGLRRRDEGPRLARHRLFRARRQTGVELARRRDPRIDRTRQPYFPESRRRSIDLRGQRDAHRPGRQDRQGVVAELPRRLAEHGSWQQFAAGGQARRGRRDRPDQIHPPRRRRHGDLPQQPGSVGRPHAHRRG